MHASRNNNELERRTEKPRKEKIKTSRAKGSTYLENLYNLLGPNAQGVRKKQNFSL